MGVYKLYKDKPIQFECRIDLKGAKLNNANARLIVESDDLSLLFQGSITKNGKCIIPIPKLVGLMEELTVGEIRLEVIVDDTYFQPWSSAFKVDVAKKLTVEVVQPKSVQSYKKPQMKVRLVNDSTGKLVNNIIRELKSKGITVNNIRRKRFAVTRCINEHARNSNVSAKSLIPKVVKRLSQ